MVLIRCLAPITVTPLATSLNPHCTPKASTASSASFLFPSNCGRNIGLGERRGFLCLSLVSMRALTSKWLYMFMCIHVIFNAWMSLATYQYITILNLNFKLMQSNEGKVKRAMHQISWYLIWQSYPPHWQTNVCTKRVESPAGALSLDGVCDRVSHLRTGISWSIQVNLKILTSLWMAKSRCIESILKTTSEIETRIVSGLDFFFFKFWFFFLGLIFFVEICWPHLVLLSCPLSTVFSKVQC